MMKVKTKSGETITLEFMESFFDSFEGTDEELQKLMQEIISKVENESLMDDAELVDVEEMDGDLNLERKLQ